MTLRQPRRPGSRRHVERTPAQERAFRVFRLRGLYWMLHALTGPRLEAAQQLVDWELMRLGAEPETERHLRRLRECWAAAEADASPTQPEEEFEELPF